jgi:hypothetical protein
MDTRKIRDLLASAQETNTASQMVQAEARRERVAWRAWRAVWAGLKRKAPAERLVTVCMYCQRFRADTAEWVVTPPDLAQLLHDQQVVQVTHGACPICVAGHLPERPG